MTPARSSTSCARSTPTPVRRSSAYLDLAGYRLLDGFDISGRYALEMPDALLRAIRSSVVGRSVEATDVEDRIADVRGQVPDEHRAQFNELLEEARLTYRIRDERGVFSDIWASGIMRRAAMAARPPRWPARARVHDAEHFVDAGFDEMRALAVGRGRTLSRRAGRAVRVPDVAHRQGGPRILGPAAAAAAGPVRACRPPPARVMRATGIALGALFGSSEAEHEEDLIRGLAASGGVYEGPARRVSGPAEFDRIVARRRAGDRVDDRGVQHPASAARRDRDRQRRPALPLRDRRA